MMRHCLAIALAVALTACGGGTSAPPSSVTATTAATVTTTTAAALPPGTTDALPTSPVVTDADEVVVTPEQVEDEPFVVECYEGTPGPALWSDGTTSFSQWCFDQLGGERYLESERQANAFECDGATCRNPYTSGSYPDPAAIASDVEERSRADAEASGCATGGCLEAYRACRDGLVSGDGCAYWGF
ncbi:conserved hypothetical protein [Rhodococcus jostii RHA1]|uniref:Lipoprotein n=1 Tax=Rhodococcus jostii (strain RHA1) TaxID=101510 RepID=Q0SG59_RHOJR|nr:conserved hypothetical protein [Rhodococcus jostii RHA1]